MKDPWKYATKTESSPRNKARVVLATLSSSLRTREGKYNRMVKELPLHFISLLLFNINVVDKLLCCSFPQQAINRSLFLIRHQPFCS